MKPKPLPPFDLVNEYLDYNPQTGIAIWKKSPANNIKAGSVAGTIYKGYLVIRFKGKTYQAHRLFWLLQTKQEPPMLVDHIDQDKTNNAFSNLRLATYSQNGMNREATKTNKLGMKGVCFDSKVNKYKASIRVDGKHKHLGHFDNPDSAFAARKTFENNLLIWP